jgi:glucose-1-phosphate thymidylyltransferase
MKALVLCAGRGTRLRPLTHTRAKAALPVAGRPVLTHILKYLSRFGLNDVGVVISPDQEELHGLTDTEPGQRVTFLVQETPLGIAHAVSSARDFLGDEPFLLYLGDNLTGEDLAPAVKRFVDEAPDALIAVRAVPNPQAFGVAELEGGRIVRVTEKPPAPRSNLAIAGIYLFRASAHKAIARLTPSHRGEYEITDAIAGLIADGRIVQAYPMTGWWQDMGTPDGMLAANALLLGEVQPEIAPDVDLSSARISGPAVIGPGVRLTNVDIQGPVIIGAGCHLENARIGPFTSVGDFASIAGSTVRNSILLPGCRLAGPWTLEDCLLGQGTVVEVRAGQAVTLLLGDDGTLKLPPGGV